MQVSFPPGPRGLPVLGCLPWLIRDPLRYLTRVGREYGDIAHLRMGKDALFINSPALIDQVVRDRTMFRSQASRRAMASFLGDGMFSLEDATHMRHRRLMQPAFKRHRIEHYGRVMEEETQRTLTTFEDGEVRDLGRAMSELTLAIVARAMFGTDQRHEALSIGDALQHVMPWAVRAARIAPLVPPDKPMPFPRATRQAIAGLQAVVQRIVTERRQAPDAVDRGDLLSMLLQARDDDNSGLSDAEIAAEGLTVLLAGHETTALALTWAFYLLAGHPEIQEALADEVLAQVGERPVRTADLAALPLCRQVLDETLRLYPPAWFGDRVPQTDSQVGGYEVPAGTAILFSVYVTQRDPRFFSDPDAFKPERFAPGQDSHFTADAYLPFGAGVHQCIGNVFALNEAQLVLASTAQRFRIHATSTKPIQPNPLVTLGLKTPFRARLESRH